MALDTSTISSRLDTEEFCRLKNLKQVGLVGVGNVGLSLAVAISKNFKKIIAYDVDSRRIDELNAGIDANREIEPKDLCSENLVFTKDPNHLKNSDIFLVGVSAVVDDFGNIDMRQLIEVSKLIGNFLTQGAVVVYESTVYPGFTEEVCGPLLETQSGLKCGTDFHLCYSPERINTRDSLHSLSQVTKIVAAENSAVLELLAEFYGTFIAAGTVKAASIKTAEASKLLENAQRDVNIALMNEASIVFSRMGIQMSDVLEVAKTKWNFFPASPGLVGGSCIRSASWHIIKCARDVEYDPSVLIAARTTNEQMVPHLVSIIENYALETGHLLADLKVGVLGIAYKEESSECRQSLAVSFVKRLQALNIDCQVFDPLVNAEFCTNQTGLTLVPKHELADLNVMVLAVPHAQIIQQFPTLLSTIKPEGLLMDLKAALKHLELPPDLRVWRL